MSTDSNETPRPLPARPNLRHLKDQVEGSGQVGRRSVAFGRAVHHCAPVRFCELAQAPGSRGAS